MAKGKDKDEQNKPDSDPPAPPIETVEAKPGHVFMIAPADVTCAGFGGESYPVDKEGCVEVPVEAIAALNEHGFVELEG